MESVLVLLMPIVLLFVGIALTRKFFPIVNPIFSWSWRALRWLWREKRQRGGAGRARQPRVEVPPLEVSPQRWN